MSEKRFIISDENVVNSYGIRVMTAGIDISQYTKNPVLLYMHSRGRVIGRVEDLRVEGPLLTGLPVFDEGDEFALEIKRKVDGDWLRACSPELEPTEWSDRPELLLMGQTFPTATKSKLYEISICDIPGNDGALALRLTLQGGRLRLSQDAAATAETFKELFPTLKTNYEPKMKLLLSRLGLSVDASEDAALAAIEKLKTDAKGETADFVLKLAKSANLIKPEKEAMFLRLAKLDPEAALEMIDFSSLTAAAGEGAGQERDTIRLVNVVKAVETKNAVITPEGGEVAKGPLDVLLLSRGDWNARRWEKEDPANWLRLKHEKTDIHTALTKAFYDLRS
ncbi:MAG: hypothetical protein V4621_08190 [Pseudomonadota bacterium]